MEKEISFQPPIFSLVSYLQQETITTLAHYQELPDPDTTHLDPSDLAERSQELDLLQSRLYLQELLDRTNETYIKTQFDEQTFKDAGATTHQDEEGNFSSFEFEDNCLVLAAEMPSDPQKDQVILVALDGFSGCIEYRLDSNNFLELSIIENGTKQWIEDESIQFEALQKVILCLTILEEKLYDAKELINREI